MSAKVAIAIVSWNTRELLHACLASMREAVDRDVAEVWVVDNGSTDGSQELVRTRHPWAKLVVPGENLGYGRAVNVVAARTTTEWIAPSNADVELTEGALDSLLASGELHPRTAVVGPRLILRDGSTQPGVQPFPSMHEALLRHLALYKLSRRIGERLYLHGYWDPSRPAFVDWITGAFLVVRRDAWDEIGGFDEAQWMYAEDLDLCWRAHRRGWEVRYEPSARVHHALSVAAEQAFGDVERQADRMVRANYIWLASRGGRRAAWRVAATEVALLSLRIRLFAALARGDPGRWEHRRVENERRLRRQRAGISAVRHRRSAHVDT